MINETQQFSYLDKPIIGFSISTDKHIFIHLKNESTDISTLPEDEYRDIVFKLIEDGPYLLEYIDPQSFDSEAYYKLVLNALHAETNCPFGSGKLRPAFRHIKTAYLDLENHPNGYYPYSYYPNRYFRLAEIALRTNAQILEYVETSLLSEDNYIELCQLAVKKDGLALKHVKTEALSQDSYVKIARDAINQSPKSMEHVNHSYITMDQYYKLALKATYGHGDSIQNIEVQHIDLENHPDRYYQLALAASHNSFEFLEGIDLAYINHEMYYQIVSNVIANYTKWDYFGLYDDEPTLLSHISPEHLNPNGEYPDRYFEITRHALAEHGHMLRCVKLEFIGLEAHPERYFELVCIAIKDCSHSLQYVQAQHLSKEQYYTIVIAALKDSPQALSYTSQSIQDTIADLQGNEADDESDDDCSWDDEADDDDSCDRSLPQSSYLTTNEVDIILRDIPNHPRYTLIEILFAAQIFNVAQLLSLAERLSPLPELSRLYNGDITQVAPSEINIKLYASLSLLLGRVGTSKAPRDQGQSIIFANQIKDINMQVAKFLSFADYIHLLALNKQADNDITPNEKTCFGRVDSLFSEPRLDAFSHAVLMELTS